MTGLFSHEGFDDHERVLHWTDRPSGLRATDDVGGVAAAVPGAQVVDPQTVLAVDADILRPALSAAC